MNKTKLFLILITMMVSFSLQARKIVVNTAATLQTAFNGAQDGDTIILKPGTYNAGTALRIPPTGAIVLKSANLDSIAIIKMDMQVAANVPDNAYPKKPSVIFEHLHLQGRYPDFTTPSAYLINLNSRYFSMDTLAFRHCEISKLSRCIFRGAAPADSASSGQMEWLEMTNCIVHEMNSRGNEWPVFYSAHVPMYVIFRNNTFYDMPRTKSIYQLNKMTALTGRNAEIYFENNTFAITYARADGIIATGNYLGEETIFQINNNMFITPNWADDYNLSTDSSAYIIPPIVKCIGGIITANNNIVDSCRYWAAGQTISTEGTGGFLVIDSANTYRMRNLNFSWNDFADAQGNDFSFLSTKQPATAGTGGKPIGDPRWVKTFANPRILSVSYTPNTIKATVTPRRAYYEDGSNVKVTASTVDGYNFKGWKKVSDEALLSTDNPYSFTINSDMDIKADYAAIVERSVSVTINGSSTATYSITPNKAKYYEGDVITIALNTHSINNFLGWADGNNEMTRTLTISGGDVNLTANFLQHPYLLNWDFDQLTANNQTFSNLNANHASDAVNKGTMNYISLDTVRTISTRNNKFTTVGKELFNCMTRRTHINNFNNPDYVYIKFSTKLLSKLKVKSIYATDNSMFKVQLMQYSINGKDYTNFATDTIKATDNIDQIWRPFEGVLPLAAENQDTVYVRWIADPTSERMFVTGTTTSDYSQIYLTKIIVINSEFTSSKELTSKNLYKIYSNAEKILVKAEAKGNVEIYSIMGRKIRSVALKTGLNEFTGFKAGIYVVKVGGQVQRVLVR